MFLKKLNWVDWLVVVAVVFHCVSVFCTNYVIFNLPLAVETAKQLEANPAARQAIDEGFNFMAYSLTLQGIWLGCYVWVRHVFYSLKPQTKRKEIARLLMYVMVFLYFINGSHIFANDFSIWLKFVLTK